MGRSSTLPISQPHSHSNGSIKTIGTTSIRKPERSRTATTSHKNVSTEHHFPIPTRHSSSPAQHSSPYYVPPPNERSSYRPSGPNRQNSVQTRYMSMLLSLDTIPRLHNILASFFTWILLAGFIIFPGTFTSLQKLDDNPSVTSSATATAILHSVKHVSLLVIAGVCCGIGAIGMSWLWYKWHQNYVWLLNRIFLPGCLNSFAGLISTLVQVYSQQGGDWSITARVTAIVTGAAMIVTGVLFALYNFWILERVKKMHGREMEREERLTGNGKEGLMEKVGRKAHEPALEPGSVV
ncbi:uncharacterized protein PAC_10438 [Phialocephala subalpina]|uniref:Uncharacterized protein n=1 Tax=Phialocephala subalpina TaxID=576137 RepID=A0A1L7X6A6_9HELO|nr:uncharacterized protein PAC_10438 [Phialocephala subalpina]